ncbi:MAG: carbohydrate-binding domain-containing protein [Bacteroidota bacterium]
MSIKKVQIASWLIPALILTLSACDSTSAIEEEDVVIADPIALSTLSCDIEGINADPFTVADAMLDNDADHEDTADYTYDAATATTIALDGITASIDGTGATSVDGIVTVAAPGTYVLSGTLTDGQIIVDTPEDGAVKLVLAGASITSSSDSGIRVDNADRAVLILAEGTTNTITDGTIYPATAEQNAAVWSDDDLSIGGTGTLTVNAQFQDGIASKDGLVIRDGTIAVNAPDEGIRGKHYLVVRGGVLDITAGGDGIKSDEEDDDTRGYILIEGGTISIDAEGDAITAETDALFSEGTLSIRAGGGANITPSDDLSTKGLKGAVMVVVDDGTFNVDTSDDGIHANDTVLINGGSIEIATGDDGVHADLGLTINGGDITLTQSFEGLEAVLGDLVINGGTLDITAIDDGFNLSGDGDDPGGVESPGDPYDMVFNGGMITITSGSDGIDSNGSIEMTNGCLAIAGPVPGIRPEQGAIDYNGDFAISGGVLLAAGAAGRMAQTPGTSSTQPSVAITFSTPQAPGTLVTLESAGGSVAIAPGKSFQSLIASAPWLSMDDTITVYRGGTVSGSSSDEMFNGGTVNGATVVGTVTVSAIITSVTL